MSQKQLLQQLKDVGSKLKHPPPSKDALIKLLKQAANCLSELDQSVSSSFLDTMKPSLDTFAKMELLKHQDRDVKVLVATCICEITRITAPEPPYTDEVLRDVFHLFVSSFSGLNDINSPSFGRRVVILETLAKYRSCVMMLDLECAELICEMFEIFFSTVSDHHPKNVLMAMQTIMILILDESEDVPDELTLSILAPLGRVRKGYSMAARRLAMTVIENCAGKLEASIKQFILSSVSGDPSTSHCHVDYHDVFYDIYQCAPQISYGVVPYITGELLADKLDVRLKAVELLGGLFSLEGISKTDPFKTLFGEYLKRLTDRATDVRLSVVKHLKSCLISNQSLVQAPEIISALHDRLLDYDESVREKVVGAIFDVACHSHNSIPSATTKLAAERLRDKCLSVKRYTMARLAELYKLQFQNHMDGLLFEWIPGRILRCLYDKDFRSDNVEDILCNSLFPAEICTKVKLKNWMTAFNVFDKVELKALEQLLMQKQRLQQDMQKYMSSRQTRQAVDSAEQQKRISGLFRSMSRLFNDPLKAEENFQILNQLKDGKIWKILSSLMDPSLSFSQAWTSRVELLKILGEKHPLHDFMETLTLKCSYLLFNKELIKAILSEISSEQFRGSLELKSYIDLLLVFARFFPVILSGFYEDLVHLLKEDNEILKEGIAHVLAKAGGFIREKLSTKSSSIDLLLERLCMEGTRKQAKYAVQALAAINKDDGLKSLSVIYKRLVDNLGERTHLPSILQSLGCIAQIAMPIFETREGEIVELITRKILTSSNLEGYSLKKQGRGDKTELCLLKVYGLKTLVKSYLPLKDAHLRLGVDNLFQQLKNILIFGDVSQNIKSSPADKAYLRLAGAKAVLRLSRQWDHKIPVEIFHLTLKAAQDINPEARRLFTGKVYQYIKDRVIDAKYVCAFLFNVTEALLPDDGEVKENLSEIIEMQHQLKARQISLQPDMNPLVAYPEYLLTYLIHVLSHHPSFPNVDACENVKAFEPIYWRLHTFLSLLLHGDGRQMELSATSTKESFSAVLSIFHSIRNAADVVDATKTKNSHALCDLGLSISKNLLQEVVEYNDLIKVVPLPELLYRPIGKEDDVSASEKCWLGEASALTYFEALSLDSDKDGKASPCTDDDSVDIPLGKIMKNLKSRAAKKKKMMKKQAGYLKLRGHENEIDITGVVREIDLEQKESDQKKDLSTSPQDQNDNNHKIMLERKQDILSNMTLMSILTPKRRRSGSRLSKEKRSNNHIIVSQKHGMGIHDRKSSIPNKEPMTISDSLVSYSPKSKTPISGHRNAGNHPAANGKSHFSVSGDATMEEKDILNIPVPSKNRRRARLSKSFGRLQKCTQSIITSDRELVGCRIEVWWPLDKQFYPGEVQSYDPIKNKHVILYDDGDVEVLHLNKEKWKLVSSKCAPEKKHETECQRSSNDRSVEQKSSPDESASENKLSSSKSSISRIYRKTTKKRKRECKMQVDIQANQEGIADAPTVYNSDKRANAANDSLETEDVQPGGSRERKSKTPVNRRVFGTALQQTSEKEESPSLCNGSDDEPLSTWCQRVAK